MNAQGQRANRGTYVPPRAAGAPAFDFPPQPITWQNDAKHYEFWTHGSDDGSFTIANVRPGTYQLHAISDGVLGAYDAIASVTITPGQKLDLGDDRMASGALWAADLADWNAESLGQGVFEGR